MEDSPKPAATDVKHWYLYGFTGRHEIKVSKAQAGAGHELFDTRAPFEALISEHTSTDWGAVDRALTQLADEEMEASFAKATKGMPSKMVEKLLAKLQKAAGPQEVEVPLAQPMGDPGGQ